jgi:leukotriene-A4 hydrolase
MYSDMMGYGYWNSYSSIHPNIRTDAPDDSFSEVPYEKGFQFMYYIESVIGETHMQEMMNDYIQEYKWQSINWL